MLSGGVTACVSVWSKYNSVEASLPWILDKLYWIIEWLTSYSVWTCALSLYTQQKTKHIVTIISLVFIIEYFEL